MIQKLNISHDAMINGVSGNPDLTLGELIHAYKTDRISGWHQLRYGVRQTQEGVLKRMVDAHGSVRLADIRLRTLEEWYLDWSQNKTKKAMGHTFLSKLRTICHYGAGFLENAECVRICIALSTRKYEGAKPRKTFITADHATAIREKAREIGLFSIAFAQALQFDLILRQKDVIGEWIPFSEPGESDVTSKRIGGKWLRGLRWEEIDENLVLRHTTSKVGKPVVIDLHLAPMVMEELAHVRAKHGGKFPTKGPMVIYEGTGAPYEVGIFRRKWRSIANMVGVPKEIFNMDSRSGGITEGTDAGLSLDQMRHAATHSNVTMTARYDRNTEAKVAETLKARVAHRQAQKQTADLQ